MKYNTTSVVGSQWGDEGKGKIVDYLAQNADCVVRYQGGNNAGHTIVINKNKFALNHIPSGIFNPKIKNYMAQGMVINPKKLIEEIEGLKKRGILNFQLFISNKIHIVLPYHIDIDKKIEEIKGVNSIGTTKNGIGPCYEDKYARIGIRFGDFIHEESFLIALTKALKIKNKVLSGLGLSKYKALDIFNEYNEYAKYLKKYSANVGVDLEKNILNNKNVLFEGAQGVMLCIENGTYPYVTSSSPTSASISLGTGINPKYLNNIISVVKAYTTRVGSGAFPSEIPDPKIENYIRETGHEYGTVTKRSRRIGWLDLVVLKSSFNLCNTSSFAITLLDVLDEIGEIYICDYYLLDGEKISYIPETNYLLEKVEPHLIKMAGWKTNTTKITNYSDLPLNARLYIEKIEELTNVKCSIFSVGPKRKQTYLKESND